MLINSMYVVEVLGADHHWFPYWRSRVYRDQGVAEGLAKKWARKLCLPTRVAVYTCDVPANAAD